MKQFLRTGIIIACCAVILSNCSAGGNLFEGSGDVGNPRLSGSFNYDKESDAYRLTGAGTNMWATNDEFFMVWRKVSGNFSLSARIKFEGEGVNAHRKIGLIIRESLAGDAQYADVCVHGDGLTSLQYRENKGGTTKEVVASHKAPDYIKLERLGNKIIMRTAHGSYPVEITGEIELAFPETAYIGLFICSHESDVLETAIFSNVAYKKLKD